LSSLPPPPPPPPSTPTPPPSVQPNSTATATNDSTSNDGDILALVLYELLYQLGLFYNHIWFSYIKAI
jgi:hypothetical protein